MAKNTAKPAEDINDENFEFDPRSIPELKDVELVDEQLGFAPYYNPIIGKGFYAKPVHFEADADRERGFDRWIFVAEHPMKCFKGPADSQEEVIVRKGELFSTSVYAQLRLQIYLGLPILLTCVKKVPAKIGNMFVFKAQATPEVSAKIAERREQLMLQAMAAPPVAKQVQARA